MTRADPASGSAPIHATSVAAWTPQGWRGLLITGPSGAGKSDLALRLIGRGWRLVSDDYSAVWRSGGRVWACAPPRIAGRIEARGLGVVPAPTLGQVRIGLVVDCIEGPPERMPEPQTRVVAGLDLPVLRLDPRFAAAPELAALALRNATG